MYIRHNNNEHHNNYYVVILILKSVSHIRIPSSTLIILSFRNNVAELHLSLLQGSGEINNTVLKL
jgi:hypothetical protein